MKYTVAINEKKKEIRVILDGYEGVAKCCPTDRFDLQTGIELALERARVAKANAEKEKATAPKSISVADAIAVLEKYVGSHVAIIGGGEEMSESQKAELRRYADMYAPLPTPTTAHRGCRCECSNPEIYEEAYNSGYEDGYDEGFEKGCEITKDEYDIEDEDTECSCECHGKCDGVITGAMIKELIDKIMKG
jgi:hypothetical protein